ncbi:MAG TPA: S9 family peptidase [Candidatus Cryosericum sp.]|nr:S9 family peptidase [Candidatus Cryosericum sp.]
MMPLTFGALFLAGASRGEGTVGAGKSPTPAGEPLISLERVARFPPPGSHIAGSFRFTHDGRVLYYLGYEREGAARSLVREEVSGGGRQIVARSAGGAGEGALSREEVLRRERLRLQDLGITQFVLAETADRVVYADGGDLYLVRPGRDALRLTSSSEVEQDPQLSPDGRLLAFTRDDDLYVLDIETLREKRLTSGAGGGILHGVAEYIAQEEMDRPTGFWWSPDGASIAYTEVDETGIPLYAIPHQGKDQPEVENHRYPFAGGPNARVRLGIVPAQGGETRWLDLASAAGEDFYLARVRWAPDGALLVQVQSRDQKTLRLLRLAPGTLKHSVLVEERSDTWVSLTNDLRPLMDGRFIWSSERSGYRHLEIRSRDGRLERALTSGDWPVDRLEGVDEAGGLVYFTAAREGPLEKPLYRVAMAGAAPERVTPEKGCHTIEMSPDGRLFVDVHDSAGTPPRVLLKEGSGRTLRVLDANDDPEIAALGLRPPEFVTLQAEDGTTLHGAIFKPRSMEKGRRYPALVRVYGGPTAQTVKDSWELTQDLRAQRLTEKGFVVFRLDNRGSPRRGKAFETALYRRLGSVEVEDQIRGARYLAALPFVDPERIGIYGWSYGGYMAALCLLRAPEIFRAAVAGAPVTDWDGYDTHYTERYMGTPRENLEGYRASSLLPLAQNLDGRLLIVHGMADENVHFRHTARLLNALNAARRRYDLLIFPDERHLPRRPEDRQYLEHRILEHFEAALPPRPGPQKPRAAPP